MFRLLVRRTNITLPIIEPGAGSVVEKLRAALGKISIAGVLRLRATSAASSDRYVMRSAQDDGFVGGLTKTSYVEKEAAVHPGRVFQI
jgi:hypothetical protein